MSNQLLADVSSARLAIKGFCWYCSFAKPVYKLGTNYPGHISEVETVETSFPDKGEMEHWETVGV